jgi:CDP-diacylglycerol---glycerol-3-phosphate 3-phosphatidyltransferase
VNEPGDLATWANAVTVGRVLLSPVMYAVINGPKGSWWAVSLWIILCASDGVDGWLARRHGTTRSGAFLDPLADKILVLGAMFVLVNVNVFWWLPVTIIAAREVAISMYRTVVGTKGVSVPAKKLAKVKTVAQQFAVGFALLPLTARRAHWIAVDLLWIAVVLTVFTGLQYYAAARRRQPAHAM